MGKVIQRVAAASAVAALIAVGTSLLALAVRETVLGGVSLDDFSYAFGHFVVIGMSFVWPPLTLLVFLIGIVRGIRHEQAGITGIKIGAAIGSVGLATFWVFLFGVGSWEALGWAIVGAATGALSGYVFIRIARGNRM